MIIHLLPCGYYAADVRLNLNGLQTTFRVTSARREWVMAMAMTKIANILKQLEEN